MSGQLASTPVPRLQNGDSLDAEEFMRRYEAMPDVKKAELIDGVVFMPSPVSADEHGDPHADLLMWLGTYRLHTPGIRAAGHATVRIGPRNVPQPNALLRIVRGGQAMIGPGGYIVGGPELVAEVAASSVSIGRNAKFRAYRDSGVREYVLWRVEQEAIDWFVLREGQYVALTPDEGGVLRSEAFPGLWLDPAAMARQDARRVHEVLMRGVASPGHAEFVERLGRAAP